MSSLRFGQSLPSISDSKFIAVRYPDLKYSYQAQEGAYSGIRQPYWIQHYTISLSSKATGVYIPAPGKYLVTKKKHQLFVETL